MNWSGGYKSRIRSRALALSRKGTYHQKNQIMLVDHVGERYERDSELNKQDNKMEMNSDISTPVLNSFTIYIWFANCISLVDSQTDRQMAYEFTESAKTSNSFC